MAASIHPRVVPERPRQPDVPTGHARPLTGAAHVDLNPTLADGKAKSIGLGPQRPISRIALDEHELAVRWGLSVKTLRRWRQQQLGPVFCKLGSRVTYLISEIEAFEKRASRYSTSARVSA